MGNVSKSDIIREVATENNMTIDVAKAVVETLLGKISAHANNGNAVNLIGFGRFEVKTRAARIGRNPSTGVPIDIPESRKMTFKASKKAA